MIKIFKIIINNIKKNKWIHFVISFVLYTLITIIIFYPKIKTITTQYGMPDIDMDGTIWYQWMLSFNHNNLFPNQITNIIGYPFGYDLTTSPFSNLIQSFYSILLNFFHFSYEKMIFIFNFFGFLSFPLSALSLYSLSFYFNKNKTISFIAGIIFSFSFYHIIQSRGMMVNLHWEFIPMYFLFLFKFLDSNKKHHLLISVAIFSLMFSTYAYYAFFSGIMSVIIFLFYKKTESIKDKIKLFFKYYSILLIFLILTNFNFVISNLYMFNSSGLDQSGRLLFDFNSTFIKLKALFLPPNSSILFNGINYGEHPIGYTLLFLVTSSLFIIKKNRLNILFFICFLTSILLCVSIPGFEFVNKIYFEFFSMFRSVAYLIIFILLFASLIASNVLNHLRNNINLFKNNIVYGLMIITIFSLFIIESLNIDKTSKMKTDFTKIENLYKPLRDNTQINNIAVYPYNINFINFGFPATYQELGQVVHNKKIATGAGPTDNLAREFQEKIKNIEDPNLINTLKSYGIDGILIYNYYLENSDTVNNNLKKDSRLEFIGRYKSELDNGIISSINNSKDISVYRIKDVTINDFIYTNNKNIKLDYKKINTNKYEVNIYNTSEDFKLILNYPYSNGFKIKSGSIFSKNLYENKKESYYNSWEIKNSDIKDNNKIYIYFSNGIIYNLFRNISILTYFALILYLIIKHYYGKK